jgi:hypothetical protein
VLVPASKLSGDDAGDVAKRKGEVEAVETALIKAGYKKPNSQFSGAVQSRLGSVK